VIQITAVRSFEMLVQSFSTEKATALRIP
jgi:hypothetical protein